MSQESPPPLTRNRRFLVSIWQKNGPAEGLVPADARPLEEQELHGLVWEADPRDPGRLVQPASFGTLSALPRILGDFLHDTAGAGPDPAPRGRKGAG